MQKPGKIVLGAATLWPFIYMFIFFGFILCSILFMRGEPSGAFPVSFAETRELIRTRRFCGPS
jgi:hypothetical protein